MSPTLEDQERHLLVKVIDRILYKLDDLVRPYVHKILVVIEPLLIDEDYYARVEGREIISNLAKVCLAAFILLLPHPFPLLCGVDGSYESPPFNSVFLPHVVAERSVRRLSGNFSKLSCLCITVWVCLEPF